jgi:MFS family permease
MLLREPARPSVVRQHRLAPWLAVATVCFGAFMGQLDASVVTLAFPALQRQFAAGLAGVQWVSLAYLLTLVALLVPVGRWSDRYGRKLVYLYGFVVFTAASAACGLAPSLIALVGLRVLQAAGAAMLQANSVALVATSAPSGRRRAALGVQAAAQALGLALGPVAGGLLIATASWRWIFFINVPVGVIALVAGWFLLPRTRQRAEHRGADPVGLALLVAAAGGTLVALSSVSGLGLPAAGFAAVAVLAVLAGAGLARWERRTPAPVIDLRMLAATGSAPLLGGALCAYLVLFGPLVLFPQVMADHGGSVTRAGLVLTALPAGFALAAVAAERVLPARWPDHRRCTYGGALATCCAAALAVPAPEPVLVLWLGLLGAGLGTYIPANNTAIMAAVPVQQAAAAGGMVNLARGLGTALGVAVVTLALHTAARLGPAGSGPAVAMAALAVAALLATWAGYRPGHGRGTPHAAGSLADGGAMTTSARSTGGAAAGGSAGADGLAEGIARLRRALRRGARVASPGNPLAVAQLELLSALAEQPGARPGQLARQLHMRPNTVTTIVNALTAQGMISRATPEGDRRAIELTITPAGQQAVLTWQATNAAVLHLAVSTLPAAQRRALAAAVPALDALAKAVDRLADTNG